MLDLTRIPDPYLVTTVVVAAAAPGAVSGLVWGRMRARAALFLPVHLAVMLAVLALGAAAFGLAPPNAPAPGRLAVLVLLGLGVYASAAGAERAVAARVRRGGGFVARGDGAGGVAAAFAPPVGSVPGVGSAPPLGSAPATRSAPWASRLSTLGWLASVAVCEELLYRGVLLDVVLLAPLPVVLVAVPATVLIFAAAHLPLGRGNAVTMLVLGGCATAAVLVSASVLPAVTGHVLYNARGGWARR